jgi:hypothetical protein
MRHVPDVSADADPASGYSVYCTVSASNCSGWLTIGGTSAAAPLWAAIATDINGYLASQGKSSLGSINSTLYSLFNTSQNYAPYHDITSGNNLYYNATSGYDVASGIGSPDAWNIARDVAGGNGGGNDFSISASPNNLSIAQGSSGSSTISTAVTSGSAATVNLTASVSPAGPTVTLSPSSVTAGGSATLNVNVGSSVGTGTYTITVTGTEGSATHATTVTLTVTPGGGGNNFSISASPNSLSIVQGSSGSSTINTTVTSGSAATINLTASVSPSGPVVTLSPGSVTAGGSATLNISVGSSVATGSYTVTVTGTEGSVTHSTTVAVTVTGNSGGGGLTNPGFETGNLNGWTCVSGDTVVSSPVHSGSYALKIVPSGTETGQCSQTVTVLPSHTYTLSAYLNGPYAFLGIQGGSTDWVVNSSYTKVSITFTTSASQTSVTIFAHGWYGQGAIYADDFSLS